MTPKEFVTQIALGSIKWYTNKDINAYIDVHGEWPATDSVDWIAQTTKSSKLLDYILDVFPKDVPRICPQEHISVVDAIVESKAFNASHAVRILTSSHIPIENHTKKAIASKIVDAIIDGELLVTRVPKCQKKKR